MRRDLEAMENRLGATELERQRHERPLAAPGILVLPRRRLARRPRPAPPQISRGQRSPCCRPTTAPAIRCSCQEPRSSRSTCSRPSASRSPTCSPRGARSSSRGAASASSPPEDGRRGDRGSRAARARDAAARSPRTASSTALALYLEIRRWEPDAPAHRVRHRRPVGEPRRPGEPERRLGGRSTADAGCDAGRGHARERVRDRGPQGDRGDPSAARRASNRAVRLRRHRPAAASARSSCASVEP